MLAAVGSLLDTGVAAGVLRADVPAADVITSLSGVTLAATERAQAGRLLDLLVDALKPR